MTKTIGKTIPTLSKETYTQLLTETLPKVIETEAEYSAMLSKAEQLTFTKNKTYEPQGVTINLKALFNRLLEKTLDQKINKFTPVYCQ